ncbi:ATPase, T2SS/T4P/T4SS family [Basilea psittacipulmonis]|uniref:ATPase, T2SS/T4P/T4SS family n=1 Tax=Basilea psittacipulmonis TaxID=1472345 RepID=UPI00068A446C|nr:ATPase, T2SS/T4P/T4SS family [Basilea psittacipulmonis]
MYQIKVSLEFEDGKLETVQVNTPASIGRFAASSIRLNSWRVAKKHAQFIEKSSGAFFYDEGTLAGSLVNGARVSRYGPLKEGDKIIIGPCRLTILGLEKISDDSHNEMPVFSNEKESYRVDKEQHDDHGNGEGLVLSDHKKIAQYRQKLHQVLFSKLEIHKRDILNVDQDSLRQECHDVLTDYLNTTQDIPTLSELSQAEKNTLIKEILDEVLGLGPLEALLSDDSISEIMVNRYDEIFVEKKGVVSLYPSVFSNDESVRIVIDRIIAPTGRHIDESSPMVDARLSDGSRVNVVLSPVALRGSTITIRKFLLNKPDVQYLIKEGSLNEEMACFLERAVKEKKNIILSGGTGTGKTTLLNILSNFIPKHERIITIEDAAELKLNHPHIISMEARPANVEGRGQITIRDLVRNALRMRPDRIVVGECRGTETLDMLTAMNTGHEGSLTTLHANSPRDALSRLETMVLLSGVSLPSQAVREQISGAIDFIIQLTRLQTGKRVISSIVEICGMESNMIKTQNIFSYDRQTQEFKNTGLMPECLTLEQNTWETGVKRHISGISVEPLFH